MPASGAAQWLGRGVPRQVLVLALLVLLLGPGLPSLKASATDKTTERSNSTLQHYTNEKDFPEGECFKDGWPALGCMLLACQSMDQVFNTCSSPSHCMHACGHAPSMTLACMAAWSCAPELTPEEREVWKLPIQLVKNMPSVTEEEMEEIYE